MDGADEAAALGVLRDEAEVRSSEDSGVAVDVGDGEVDGGPGGPPDDGVEGEEGADGEVGRPGRAGEAQNAAEAEDTEQRQSRAHLASPLEELGVRLSPESGRYIKGGRQELHPIG